MTASSSPVFGADQAGFALAVHGGAGTIRRDQRLASRLVFYHEGLRSALETGREVLASGGNALEAVTRTVAALEDDPLFNAASTLGGAACSPPPERRRWMRR
jgi:isoaspartyl peptidase/L-asparaginase-like protein (Ntn-hydrolase superfamily)